MIEAAPAMEANAPIEANFLQVTPFMHVPDVNESVRFFTERLGFRALVHANDYAYVHREAVGFRILRNAKEPELGERRILYYIDVGDVDTVVAELAPQLADLPEHHVIGPKDQEYGQREYMVRLPDGMVLVYGQAIQRDAEDTPGSSGEWNEAERG